MIAGLSVAVLLLSGNNYFSTLVYVTSIVLYIIISFILIFYDFNLFAYLRLLVDYAIIGIVLFHKDVLEFNSVILLLLPIINSPNSTKAYRKIIFPILLTVVILLFNKMFSFEYIIGLIVLMGLSYVFYKRIMFYNAFSTLYEKIDDHYMGNTKFQNIHKLLKEIIQRYNWNPWVKYMGSPRVTDIYCFERVNNLIFIRSSSTFLWEYDISILVDEFDKIKDEEDDNIVDNVEVKLDGQVYSTNSAFQISFKSKKFIIIIVWEKAPGLLFNIVFQDMFIERIFRPYFSKIVKLMIIEYNIRKEKRMDVLSLKENQNYLNNAKTALHFLRNKFTPIQNYLEMVDSLKSADAEKKKIIEDNMKNEFENAKRSVQSITQKTSTILDKAKDPFYAKDIKYIRARMIYIYLREIWDEIIGDPKIEVKSFDEQKKAYSKIDVECIEMVFYDLIRNMKNFHQSYKSLQFSYNDDFIIIHFINDFKNDPTVLAQLKEIVEDITSKGRAEIIRRKAHGLLNVINFLEQMDIKYEFKVEENKYLFEVKLFLKRVDNGNSNI